MTRDEELAAIEVALADPRKFHRVTRAEERAYREEYPAGMPTYVTRQLQSASKRRKSNQHMRVVRTRKV